MATKISPSGFTEQTEDISGKPFQIASTHANIFAWGTWDGATLKLQLSPDSKQWFDVTALTFTQDSVSAGVELGGGYARWVLSDAGSTSLNAAFCPNVM